MLLDDRFAELDQRLSAIHSDYRNHVATNQDVRAVFRAFYESRQPRVTARENLNRAQQLFGDGGQH